MENSKNDDIFGRTWKTVVVLVGACVLFVGALAGTAVLLTSHAFPEGRSSASAGDNDDNAKADSKPDAKSSTKPAIPSTTSAKKPVSI